MPAVVCPGCGAVVQLDKLARGADEFCSSCDFPLFWAENVQASEEVDSLGYSIRRRPGAGGRHVIAPEPCPVCREPNRPTAVYCHRCGSLMHPPPPPPLPPEEPARPEKPEVLVLPPTRRRPWWHRWWVVPVLAVLLLVVVAVVAIVLVLVA